MLHASLEPREPKTDPALLRVVETFAVRGRAGARKGSRGRASPMIVAALMLAVVLPGISLPVAAQTPPDPGFVGDQDDGLYWMDRGGNQGAYTYTYYWNVCNYGEQVFNQDNYRIYNGIMAGGGAGQPPAPTWNEYDENIDGISGGVMDCVESAAPLPSVTDDDFWCCGTFDFTPTDNNQNADQNNDHRTFNDHTAVFHNGQEREITIAVYNPLGTSVAMENVVPELPGGWVVTLDDYSIEVEPGQTTIVHVTVQAPSEITEWIDFEISSNGISDHRIDQGTTLHFRDAGTDEDTCAGGAMGGHWW